MGRRIKMGALGFGEGGAGTVCSGCIGLRLDGDPNGAVGCWGENSSSDAVREDMVDNESSVNDVGGEGTIVSARLRLVHCPPLARGWVFQRFVWARMMRYGHDVGTMHFVDG